MMRCFQGDRKMKHGKKCKIDKYTLILIVLLLLLTGLVIAWKLPQKEDRYIHVGIAVYDRSDTFMESYIRELEDKIGQTRILGKKVSYEIYDAEGIGSRQEKQLQEMYAQDYDVMLVNLVEPASAASVLTDAKDADIPVILFNREIDEKDLKISKNVWYVGTDARAAGVMQGELLKDLWKKQSRILDWNGNGMLDYVLVEGEESHFDAIRRTSGFLETGAELPLNQKGKAVICNNDDMALGVYDYYKEKNLKLPVIIGINNSEEMHQKIMSGEMYGTIDNKMEDQVMEICRLMQAILKKDTGSYQKVWYSTPKAIVKAEGTE